MLKIRCQKCGEKIPTREFAIRHMQRFHPQDQASDYIVEEGGARDQTSDYIVEERDAQGPHSRNMVYRPRMRHSCGRLVLPAGRPERGTGRRDGNRQPV